MLHNLIITCICINNKGEVNLNKNKLNSSEIFKKEKFSINHFIIKINAKNEVSTSLNSSSFVVRKHHH